MKFNDGGLNGLPLRLTVSQRSLGMGGVEVQVRAGGETAVAPVATLVTYVTSWLASAR